MTSLKVEQLTFGYLEHPVLRNVNLAFEPGTMVGLIGPNGAGKSTLLRLLFGLTTPQNGGVILDGAPINQLKKRQLARKMTLVPQETQVNYSFSVEEIVAMGRNPWLGRFQLPSAEDMAIIETAMSQTDVLQFARRPIQHLSGGERQRVLVARAIAQETPVVMLDEATANLDICHQLEILELARHLAQQGRLVVAAIHDLAMASRFCDRLILIAEQQIQVDGSAEEVITEETLARFFHLQAIVSKPKDYLLGGLMIQAHGVIRS